MKKKKILVDELNLNEDQIWLLCLIINSYGTGGHPYCDEKTYKYLYSDYILKVFNSNRFKKNIDKLTEKGKELYNSIIEILK